LVRDVFEQDLAGGDRIGWMEIQLRRARDKVSQMEAIVAESNRQVRNFTEKLNEMDATIQAYANQVEITRQVHTTIGRLKEQISIIDEAQQAVVRRTDEAKKMREAQAQNDLQERALLAKRIEEVERRLGTVDTRTGRNVDVERKLNDRLDGLQKDFESSRRELLSENERSRVQFEQFRRLEEQLSQFDEVRSGIQDLKQQMEVRQVEQGRAGGKIAELEQQLEELRKGSSGFADKAARVEAQMTGYFERISAIEGLIEEGRKGVLERLLRFAETQEQQRRRQIEDMQREIRELRRYAARLRED
jgi:chromosome segregation ATPase